MGERPALGTLFLNESPRPPALLSPSSFVGVMDVFESWDESEDTVDSD